MEPTKGTNTINSALENIRESDLNKDIMSDPRLRKIVLAVAVPILLLYLYSNQAMLKQEQAAQAEDAAKLAQARAQVSQSPTVQDGALNQSSTPDPKSELAKLYSQARESFDGQSYEIARDRAKAALELAIKLKEEKSRLDCLELLADAAIARGRTDAALEYYKQMSPDRYQMVLKRQVENLEQAAQKGSRGETERLAKLVCEMAELGKSPEASVLKRALLATEKAHLMQYAAKLKGLK